MAFLALMFVRYYSAYRYPQVKAFESYYVQQVDLSEDLQMV